MVDLVKPPEQDAEISAPSVSAEQRVNAENERYKHSKAARVYYMWLSRLFTFVCFAMVAIMCFLTLSLLQAAPEFRVDPVLIPRTDESKTIARLEDFTRDMSSREILLQMFIKQYVELRNTVTTDMAEMERNWRPGGIMFRYSAPTVFETFSKEKEPYWPQIEQKIFTQEVEIVSVVKFGASQSYKVDFKTYGMDRNEPSRERYWTASITATFLPYRKLIVRRLINPIGFSVIRYSQTEVEVN